ncbi:MAG: lasso peptide biosynthesis B2 protein [Novosphingobium sp.]
MSVVARIARGIAIAPKRLRRLFHLSWRGKLLAFEALAMLAIARIWLIVRPFQRIAVHLGTAVPTSQPDDTERHLLAEPQLAQARQVSAAVRWIARFAPFRAVCIHQSIAAKMMLRRRDIPSTMYFGVSRNVEEGQIKLAAHAWVRAGQVEMTGFDEAPLFQEIARFR